MPDSSICHAEERWKFEGENTFGEAASAPSESSLKPKRKSSLEERAKRELVQVSVIRSRARAFSPYEGGGRRQMLTSSSTAPPRKCERALTGRNLGWGEVNFITRRSMGGERSQREPASHR